ncbi:MAG: amidohydrolase family protein [Bryobacteraceae bacterium]
MRDGVILDIGPTRRVENLKAARSAPEINAAGRVVMPGFVDSHTHLVGGGARMDLEGDALLLAATRNVRGMQSSRLEARARAVAAGMLRHGTTTFEAKSGYGLDRKNEFKMLRVCSRVGEGPWDLVPTFMGARFLPPEFAGEPDRFLDSMTSLFTQIRKRKLARFVDVACEPGRFNEEQSRRYLRTAREAGFLLKVHAGESPSAEAVRLALEMEAVSVDHLEDAGEAEIAALADSETIATLIPARALWRGRLPPARRFIDRGAAVALASNFGPEGGGSYSMQAMITLASAELGMTTEEALMASTFNGACALRLEHRLGSFEPGKQADLLLLNCSDYRDIAYQFGVNQVHLAMKLGVVVYQEGRAETWPKLR